MRFDNQLKTQFSGSLSSFTLRFDVLILAQVWCAYNVYLASTWIKYQAAVNSLCKSSSCLPWSLERTGSKANQELSGDSQLANRYSCIVLRYFLFSHESLAGEITKKAGGFWTAQVDSHVLYGIFVQITYPDASAGKGGTQNSRKQKTYRSSLVVR